MKTNMVKRLAAAMLAATVAIGTPMAVSAAWKTEGKGWNWTVNGQNATGWQMIDNTWYYFNAQGTMQTGWVQYGNSWFFLQPSGAMATGWVNDNGQYYYTKSNGAMATGWVQDNGTWYCMSSSGAMRTGWVASGNDWYYLAPTGAMVTGAVIKVDNAVYSIAADGSMQTGEVTIAGKTYTFGEDGAATGDNIPEPDRTFSSAATPGGTAAETTPTTPPADTTPTTPSKPNRPSYGGGGSTTPDPDEPTREEDITVKFVTAGTIFGKDVTTMSEGAYSIGEDDVVSGVAKRVEGYTGFNGAVVEEQAGYYVPLAFVLSKPVTETTTITIQKGTNSQKTFKGLSSVVEDTDGLPGYIGNFVCVFRLGDAGIITNKTFTIEVDYGDGSDPVTKTLTFTGVTKEGEQATPEVADSTIAMFTGTDKVFENGQKAFNDICSLTGTIEDGKIKLTGTVKKITEAWTEFSSDSQYQTGLYIAFKLKPGTVDGTAKAATVTIEGTVPAVAKVEANGSAEFCYRIGNTDTTPSEVTRKVTVDYGEGVKKEYTLDLTGVTAVAVENAPSSDSVVGDDTNE